MNANASSPTHLGYANQVVTKPPAWHLLVVFDILFNNLATGLFIVAALGELAAPAVFAGTATWAYPVALVLLLTDFGFLVMDLGDKLRFHHMLRVLKPSSPMSLGTWCLTIYSIFLSGIVGIDLLMAFDLLSATDGFGWWARKLAVASGIPFAFGSAAYKGVLFSTTAQPGWKDARWLGAYLMNSALLLGSSELLVIAALRSDSPAIEPLILAVGLLVLLNLVPLGLLSRNLWLVLTQIYTPRSLMVAITLLILGVMVPVGLVFIGEGFAITLAAFLVMVLGHFGIRLILVRLPHLRVKLNVR